MSDAGESADALAGWCVYIVRCADASLYTGITNNLQERLRRHNCGRGAKYTRSRLPVELVFSQPCGDKGLALRRESEIKRMNAAQKRNLVENAGRAHGAE